MSFVYRTRIPFLSRARGVQLPSLKPLPPLKFPKKRKKKLLIKYINQRVLGYCEPSGACLRALARWGVEVAGRGSAAHC